MSAEAAIQRAGEDHAWHLSGSLSFDTAARLLREAQRLADEHGWPRVVNLAEVKRSDSAGLALLLELLRLAGAANQSPRFEHPPEQLLSIARMSELETLLTSGITENGGRKTEDGGRGGV